MSSEPSGRFSVPAFGLAGDAQGEFFEFAEQGAEGLGVGEPGLVAGGLLVGEVDGDGLAVDLAGPLVVGAVQPGGGRQCLAVRCAGPGHAATSVSSAHLGVSSCLPGLYSSRLKTWR